MKIIVGLGNPIPKYQETRHNIGQAIVSYFGKIKNFPEFSFKKKFASLISEGRIDQEKIILVLPQTFMNESGRAVKKIIENCQPEAGPPWAEKLQIANLFVVHDDIDLPLGKIRIRQSGSSGGHKGIESTISHLKTEKFIRFKIGIANEKRKKIPAERFVLQKFERKEKEIVEKVIKKTEGEIVKTIEKFETKTINI